MASITTRAGKGSALTWTEADNNITNLNTAKLENVVEDTTPQLGGSLDVNGMSIVSTSNGNITLAPNGTGKVVLSGQQFPVGTSSITGAVASVDTGRNPNTVTLSPGGGLAYNGAIVFTGSQVTSMGLTAGVTYYIAAVVSAGTYELSASMNGSPLTLSNPGTITNLNYSASMQVATNGQVLTYNTSGVLTWASPAGGGIASVSADTNPSLGGDLNVNGRSITSLSNGPINIIPNGSGNIALAPITGSIILGALSWPSTTGSNGQVLTTNGSTATSWTTPSSGGLTDVVNDTTPQLGGNLDLNTYKIVTASGNMNLEPAAGSNANITTMSAGNITMATATGNISLSPGSGKIVLGALDWPTSTGTNGQVLTTNGTTAATWTTPAAAFNPASPGPIGATTAAAGAFTTLSATGAVTFTPTASINISPTGITNTVTIAPATTGGSINNMSIGGTTKAAGTFTTMTADVAVLDEIRETIYALTYGATITPDAANGSVQKVTLTGNVTFSAFNNPVAGQSITLIITQDATGSRTLTSTMLFAGGSKTLSTAASAVDIITVFFDGTTYYASLAKGFV